MLLLGFLKAFKGLLLWKKLEKKFNADKYILMPKEKEEYNFFTLLYMDEFIEKNGDIKKIILLTFDKGVKKSLKIFANTNKVEIYPITRKKAEYIIQYYALYEFSTKLKIISLTEPYDTCGENLIGVKGVTKEDLVCFDILRLDRNMRKIFPVYDGDDKDVLEFYSLGNKVRSDG